MFFLTAIVRDERYRLLKFTGHQQHNIYNHEKKQIIICTRGFYSIHGNS